MQSNSVSTSKPASFLSMDSGIAASKLGSFASHDKVQGMQSLATNAQAQQMHADGMAHWGQQDIGSIASSVDTVGMQSRGGRHTHQE